MRSQSIGSTSIAAALTVTLISGFFFAPTTPASAAETLEPPLILRTPLPLPKLDTRAPQKLRSVNENAMSTQKNPMMVRTTMVRSIQIFRMLSTA